MEEKRENREIIVFAESLQYGGMEKYLFDLCNSLCGGRYSVKLLHNADPGFCSRMDGQLSQDVPRGAVWLFSEHPLARSISKAPLPQLAKSALRALTVPLRYASYVPNALIILSCLLPEKPHAVHIINGGYPGSMPCHSAALAAKLAGVKRVFFTVLSTPAKRRIPLVERSLDFITSRCSTLFIPNCSHAAGLLNSLRGIENGKLRTIYTSPGPPAGRLGKNGANSFRLKNGIGKKDLLICFTAVLEPYKGHADLIAACSDLKRKGICFKLVLIGDGRMENEMARLVSRENLDENVIFTGWISNAQLSSWLSSCDLFAFPSLQEGLPYSVIEAMQYGLPIIATKIGGIPELIVHEESGLLVPPNSPTELSCAILKMASDKKLAAKLGKNAKARAKKLFSLSKMVEMTKDMYELS